MSDRLKLSDPQGDSETARIAFTIELDEDEKRIRQLKANIAALKKALAEKARGSAPAASSGGNKIGARKHASFKAISTAPSINKTPIGPTMVPIPYPTVQDLSSSVNTAKTVNFNGCPAYLLDATTQQHCTGDEPGTGKGVKSGTVSGEVKPVKGSSTVRIEGKQVLRDGDPCTMNRGNNPGVYVTTCAPSPAPPKAAASTSNPPIIRETSPNTSRKSSTWDADNPLGLPEPQTISEKIAAQMQREMLSGTSGLERLKSALKNQPIGPQLVPWDPTADSAKQLKTTNSLEIALLGIFGGPGDAARLAGQSEEKVSAANQVGAATMGVALSIAGLPERQSISFGPKPSPATQSSIFKAKPNTDAEPTDDGIKIVGTGKINTADQRIAAARIRQATMLQDNIGFNISPTAWDAYPTIGRNGTFISDEQGIMNYFGDIIGKTEITLPASTVAQIEQDMGLIPGTLKDGFKVRQVTEITEISPRSPLEGNQYFLGAGNHLPGGAPEMVIDSIPTADNEFVKTLLNVKVESK